MLSTLFELYFSSRVYGRPTSGASVMDRSNGNLSVDYMGSHRENGCDERLHHSPTGSDYLGSDANSDTRSGDARSVTGRRFVSWTESPDCSEQLFPDANSLSFEYRSYAQSEESNSDVLDLFMRRKNITQVESLDFLYEKTSTIVEKLFQESLDTNSDRKKTRRNSHQIFDMACKPLSLVNTTLKFCDDTSFSYPNSGIIGTSVESELVSQSDARDTLRSSAGKDKNSPKLAAGSVAIKVPTKQALSNWRIPKNMAGNGLNVAEQMDVASSAPITLLDYDMLIKSARCDDWQPALLLEKDTIMRSYNKMGAYSCPLNTYSAMSGYITAAEQRENNLTTSSRSTLSEQRLQEKLRSQPIGGNMSSIPIFRGATTTRLKYPFGKCDGIAWPIVQPYDAINIQDEAEIKYCDATYQMSNLSCYSHERQEMFICATDNDRWRADYNFAKHLSDDEMLDKGRFKWRIGYQRISCELNHETLVKNHQEQEKLERNWLNSLDDELVYEVDDNELMRLQDAEARCDSRNMGKHVEFHLVDEFSSGLHGGGRIKLTPPEWITPLLSSYVPAMDRCDQLCEFVTAANKDIYQYMRLLRFPDLACSALIVRNSFSAAFAYQTRSSRFLCSVKSEDMVFFTKRHKGLSILADDLKKDNSFTVESMLRNFVLRDYEYSNWTIIWDSLATAFRKYPFVAQMLPLLKGELNTTFKRVCNVSHRNTYFKMHAEMKRRLVEKKKKAAEEKKRLDAAVRESCTAALRVFP